MIVAVVIAIEPQQKISRLKGFEPIASVVRYQLSYEDRCVGNRPIRLLFTGLYTLMAVYVHFNRFIDLSINSLTNPYNLPFQWAVVSRGTFWF